MISAKSHNFFTEWFFESLFKVIKHNLSKGFGITSKHITNHKIKNLVELSLKGQVIMKNYEHENFRDICSLLTLKLKMVFVLSSTMDEKTLDGMIATLNTKVTKLADKYDEEKKRKLILTKQWIQTTLFEGSKNLEYFVTDGCKIMIFSSWEFDDLVKILKEMIQEGTIEGDQNGYSLTLQGKFNVKKHTFIPLFNLVDNQSYLEKFVAENKTICDMEFIDALKNKSDKAKTDVILNWTKFGFESMAKILTILAKNPPPTL